MLDSGGKPDDAQVASSTEVAGLIARWRPVAALGNCSNGT